MRKQNRKIFLNPFVIFPERRLAAGGLVILLLAAAAGHFLETHIGILRVNSPYPQSFFQSFLQNAASSGVLAFFLYVAGKWVNKKTRIIDILNAALWQRGPNILLVLFIRIPVFKAVLAKTVAYKPEALMEHLTPADLTVLSLLSLIAILLGVYAVVVCVNGYKTATNAKKTGHYVVFAIALFLSHICYELLVQPLIAKI